MVHVCASHNSEYLDVLESGLDDYKVMDCIVADRVTDCIGVNRMTSDASPMPSVLTGQSAYKVPNLNKGWGECNGSHLGLQ